MLRRTPTLRRPDAYHPPAKCPLLRSTSRYHLPIQFGPMRVLYMETVASPVLGIGHYEPLRHYAEVHLRLRPGERGSGIRFVSLCHVDDLSLNWMKDSGKFTAVLQRLNPDKSSWGSASLSANIKQKDKVTELQLEKLSMVEGSSLQDVSLKGVSLLFNEAAQFPALANFTEITSMSEEQIETVFEDVQETFNGLLGGLLGGLFSSFGTK